jgi:hypothetical protein
VSHGTRPSSIREADLTSAMPGAIAADEVSYADLYARWEHGNWRATEIGRGGRP